MVWGSSSSAFRSCSSLLSRVERNDDAIEDLVFLSTKNVTESDWERLIQIIRNQKNQRTLKSLCASGHSIGRRDGPAGGDGTDGNTAMTAKTAFQLGQVIHESSQYLPWNLLALGDCQMGHNEDEFDAFLAGMDSPFETLYLGSLDLSYKGLSTKNHLSKILQLTSRCKALRELDLSRNPGLCNYFDLHNNGDDATDTEKTTEQKLNVFPHISKLNLASNNMDGNNARALLEGLSLSNNCGCRELNLSQNPIGFRPFNVLGICPSSIRELNLSNCNLDDSSFTFTHLTKATNETSNASLLESLDLSNNQISAKSMIHFAKWLETSNQSANLRHFNLSGNPLTSSGIKTLVVDGLVPRHSRREQSKSQSAQVRRLETLDLSHTQCDVEGALVSITSSNVSSLRLFDNKLGTEGFLALSRHFETMTHDNNDGDTYQTTLESLDMAGNGASEEAVIHLLRGLLVSVAQKEGAENDGSTKKMKLANLKTVIVGGNEGGEKLENFTREILTERPNLDIARDRVPNASR